MYLVQLEEDARSGFVEAVFVLLRALAPRRHIHVAHFAGGWRFAVVADRPFLGTVRRRSWFLILCNGSTNVRSNDHSSNVSVIERISRSIYFPNFCQLFEMKNNSYF